MKYNFEFPGDDYFSKIERRVVIETITKKPILARIILLVYKQELLSRSEISNILKVDNRVLYHYLLKLNDLGLMQHYDGNEVMLSNENNDMHNKVRDRYKEIIGHKPMIRKHLPVFFYYMTNKGKEYIPYCCELFNIHCEEVGDG